MNYICVLPTKDGEDHVGKSIQSLLTQTVKPQTIYVIDDGSSDSTPRILFSISMANSAVRVIRHESSTRDFQRIPFLYNLALKNIPRQSDLDFILFTSDDAVYPATYMEQLLNEFKNDKELVVASGDFEEKQILGRAPQGTGRLISYPYYVSVGGYPEGLWGWESWILFKALMDERKIKSFPHIRFQHVRPYSNASIVTFGYAMWGLGYSPLMVLLRFGINFLRKYVTFKQNWIMLGGYLTAAWHHYPRGAQDFRKQLQHLQHQRILYLMLCAASRVFRIRLAAPSSSTSKYGWC